MYVSRTYVQTQVCTNACTYVYMYNVIYVKGSSGFWSAATEAAACKCAAARLSPAFNGVPDQHNVVPTPYALLEKKSAQPNAQLIFVYSASDLHSLTPCLRGEVDPGGPTP